MKNWHISLILLCGIALWTGCESKSPSTENTAETPKPEVVTLTDSTQQENAVEQQIVNLTAADFDAFIQSENKVLVDFWAPWCGPCMRQGEMLHAWSEAGKLPDTAKIGKVNVDEEGALAQKFGIQGIPALFIFQKGEIVEKFVGVQDETTIVGALK
ncbi:MAG: thioredoxin domain-containing protein [Planctomycetia bacterium]|nr:thioredoxin domain-containing protein [Planctomycetia bacterium]